MSASASAFDESAVRRRFPVLSTGLSTGLSGGLASDLASGLALFDNAGGSAPVDGVVERVRAHLATMPVQLGATYALSRRAQEAVDAGRAAAARLVNAPPGEIVLGPSSSALVKLLARALEPLFAPGDELVVTNLDHEANVGPWRELERAGLVLREWRFDARTHRLELADLEPLLSPRTRLVACTQLSNVVGAIHDVPAIAERVHAAGAWLCVDGVAFAPHRRVDVRALGADFWFASAYKLFGPHVAFLWGRAELLARARGQNWFFHGEDAVPAKLEPGGPIHELVASLPGITEYLDWLGAGSLERAFAAIAEREAELAAPLLAFLDAHPGVRLLGPATADPRERVPTIAFTVDGRRSSEIVSRLDEHGLALRYGHFYAYRAIRDLGLLDQDGVVRASLLHYNTPAEVARLVEALDHVL